MSAALSDSFVELPPLMATCRQDVAVPFAGWSALIDGRLREGGEKRIQTAIDEVDRLLAAGLSEHALHKTLWSFGAEALPDRSAVATLHGLRDHLQAKVDAL